MADLGREINVVGAVLQGIEVVGDRLPRPGQALVQGGTRDVLDAFHQLDELITIGGSGRAQIPRRSYP